MKKLLIGLFLSVAMSASAFAEETMCEKVEKLSVQIMKNRQSGVSLTKALKAGDTGIVKIITMDAYDQSAMRTPENALRQRTEFGVKWMLACIKNT